MGYRKARRASLMAAATLVGVLGCASPASAECYRVTVYNGSSNPPSVTVCPND